MLSSQHRGAAATAARWAERLYQARLAGVATPVTVNEVLDGQVGLDVQCLDRIYLNAYVPNLQVGGQVVSFLTAHLGFPIPSPAIFERLGTAFRRAVARFADAEHVSGGPVHQGRPEDRGDGSLPARAGDRSLGSGRDRGRPGVRPGVHRNAA